MIRRKLTPIFIGALLFLAISSMPAFSQDNGKVSIGGYAAPVVMATSFFNFSQWDLLFGIRGGITFNNFTIGLTSAGSSMFTSLYEPHKTLGDTIGFMFYNGLFLEYAVMSEQKWHFSIPLELVIGSVNIGKLDIAEIFSNDSLLAPYLFLGVIPGINFDIKVAEFFVIGLHAGYRFSIFDVSIADNKLTYYDIWGIQTGLVLRFGKF